MGCCWSHRGQPQPSLDSQIMYYGCYKSVFSQKLYFRWMKTAGSSGKILLSFTSLVFLFLLITTSEFAHSPFLRSALISLPLCLYACNCPTLFLIEVIFVIVVGQHFIFSVDISYFHDPVQYFSFVSCR